MSNWIEASGVLVNVDNLVDILSKKQQSGFTVVGYTPSGFGIVLFTGTQDECKGVMQRLGDFVSSEEL